ncbi:putative tRNA (guanosine(18)-2'-O)-methyltransferase [Rosa chinensis]|uniref:tRNA (guanosine(18)-2'-O)-methyltransferase TARBP1 n=1 Tax=Rosa chinensis TaxID=74649 RepID=A0A2P6P8Y8_ROSCH|nr:uncharacterized protein LOC112179805 [Rosa chinensis]PRQ18401.1 putative tRNA (guanosine(18)-2'-O)-methyltransferase [Rosa chinensis]
MSTQETHSMATLITSLSTSFSQVPPAAVPAVLDCILASTGVSRSSLFASLLDTFTKLSEGVMKNDQKLDSHDCNYLASLVGALCHLLKKFDTNLGALESFIWKCFLPLIKMAHMFSRNMLNQITESFINAVTETNTWVVVEATLVPIFLTLVASSIGMPEKEVSDTFQLMLGSNDWVNHIEMTTKNILSPPGSPSLPISCHILTLMLDAVLQSQKIAASSESIIANGCFGENFAGKLTWGLCSLTEQLLLQNLEHRSCATAFLLPIIFKAFSSYCSFQISIDGQTFTLSRNNFFMKIWKCCGTLFSLGTVERRDAFGILSLYLSFFPFTEESGDTNMSDKVECFDIRAETKFWDEIKRGLVDKESLVRKQSLHILKIALRVNGAAQPSGVLEDISAENNSMPHSMTKRELWADKEAKSLGVGKICSQVESSPDSQNKWEAFVLLYEMLEEYGTHLVEAAWNYQVSLLLRNSSSDANNKTSISGAVHQNQIESPGEIFNWLAILWERGFNHDNPQVRCLIMQSFLGIDWKNYGTHARTVPGYFVLGSFIQGLNDPVHHKEFGVKGIYSSMTIEGAANFLSEYTSYLNVRKCIMFLSDLASAAKRQPLGRVGLMCLAECISSAACLVRKNNSEIGAQFFEDGVHDVIKVGKSPHNDKIVLLDALRFIIESSKQHFNSNYRLRVCEKVLDSAASVVCTCDLPLDVLLHFISTFPWEFTDHDGPLREKIRQWLMGCGKRCSVNCCSTEMKLLKSLYDFPNRFTSHCNDDASTTFDDEDLDAWEFEAKRWARVLFIACMEEYQLLPILMFIQNHGSDVCKQNNKMDLFPVKFFILILSLVLELQMMQERVAKHGSKLRTKSEFFVPESMNEFSHADVPNLYQKFTDIFLLILEELVSFANLSCSIFSNNNTTTMRDATLPGSVTGKLGGPSQRRLSSSTTTAVLQAIMSMKAVATISSFCARVKTDVSLDLPINFLWDFFWKTISSPACDSETGAEIRLAAYEALAPTLTALVSVCSPQTLDILKKNDSSLLSDGKPLLDSLVLSFLQNINKLLTVGVFVRSRRAILMNWKWICLESLLSIPCYALRNGLLLEANNFVFSGAALRCIFSDILESLENAGEGSVLPMLRSVRLVLDLFAQGKSGSLVCLCDGVDSQMLWHLVHSSWILHVSCNKRKVAPIAALLSSVLHSSLFSDESMHIIDGAPGPLKWFVEKILEEGTKSPRTIRLAALHLTGLWLSYPRIIKYYVKELKLLSLHGSVAFDEDFEGELADNRDTRAEVSLLAKGPDPELTKAFINTELYARASVAVLFYKLADMAVMVGSTNENADCHAALESGKMFLLELLDSAVNDKDLAKELYKKYSAIHRRKVRAWQMICILSHFVCQDIVSEVARCLHTSLYRNNLPAVRQYLETFAINIYLKFPSLVGEQLVPILRDYDMRPQALSSYVFIAANVILHASQSVQHRHLNELLPPIVPLLTSHHHSLRGFTQLLVYQVLCKLFPPLDSKAAETMTLEKRCFEDLKSYLAKNSDCTRLRQSMEGYLDAYSPHSSVTPAGVFINRVEDVEFECVPKSLMDQVLNFLNDVREDLRNSMAKDVVTIKNESLRSDGDQDHMAILSNANERKLSTRLPKDTSLDFQKKITLSKHEKQDINVNSHQETYKQLQEIEKDDKLLAQVLQSRTLGMERERSSRQHLILVASLLDRIPNLAGLARTCEVFKASSLAIADTNVLHDKQFQLISVTAEKWVPIIEVPVNSLKVFLQKKKREGFSILGLEQTANSIPLDQYIFPKDTVLVLGREKEGIPVDIIHILDACLEIPQLGVVRSLNVHVSGAIALWEYTRQQRSQ